jgi:ferredoxin
MKPIENLAAWITHVITDFIDSSPHNTLQNSANERAFATPLVGFSCGDDPIYETYKTVVGPFHWTPLVIFNRTFQGLSVKPEDLTVISWILPPYCLFYTKGICGKCISRCPVEALSEAGHDKIKCLDHLKPVTEDYVKAHYGFDGYGCGLCQTKVPCESKIPTRQDVE